MSISAAYTLGVTVTETLGTTEDPFIDTSDDTAKFKLLLSNTLNSGTTPDAEKVATMQVAMTAGAVTLDLTALTHRAAAVSFSGKKARFIIFRNPATNANAITIVEGGSNGNALLGAGFSVTLEPGQAIGAYLADAAPTVGGSDKTLDITGTGSQALDVVMIAG